MNIWKDDDPAAVLGFWFGEVAPTQWFTHDPALDAAVRDRFEGLFDRLDAAGAETWEATPDGALAAIVVFDQFPRNMFRGTPRAFATDARALAIAERAVAAGFDARLAPQRRAFVYMPFQHAEDRDAQARSVALFAALGDPNGLDYARRHKAIIDRFGRFPHRNAILGRASTAAETAFLKEPGSSF